MRSRAILACALLALAAGCIGDDAAVDDAGPHAAARVASPFILDASGCTEGGGHSVYNFDGTEEYLPAPWVPADVSDEVGDPMIGTYGTPIMGPAWGIYHTTVICPDWALDGETGTDLRFGFVAVQVEPPPFDPGEADVHYLIDVFSSALPQMTERLSAAGLHATEGDGVIEWMSDGVLHTVLDDVDHGTYESHLSMEPYRELPARTVRLWMTHPVEGGYAPMAIDLVGGPGEHLVGYGVLSHLGTGDHPPLPGAAGNVAGLAYTGFERSITVGPMPEVVLTDTWEH